MNPIERYNHIINSIEDIIEVNPLKDTNQIINELMHNIGITIRDMATVIKFFTDMSLAEYVRKRKMDYSYKKMQEQKEYDIDSVIDFTGYADHSSYSKAFKKEYGISPKKAYDEKKDLRKPPLTMEALYDNEVEVTPECTIKKENVFGVDQNTYQNIIKAEDLKELYGFNSRQANIAFEHFKECEEFGIESAFEVLAEDISNIEEIMEIDTKNLSEEKIKALFNIWDDISCSFPADIPTSQIVRLCHRLCQDNVRFEDIDENFGEYYMIDVLVEEYLEGYKVYLEHKKELTPNYVDEYFEELESTHDGISALGYILAFNGISGYKLLEGKYDMDDEEEDMYLEELEKPEHQDIYGNDYLESCDPFDENEDDNDPDYIYRVMYRERPAEPEVDDESFYKDDDEE